MLEPAQVKSESLRLHPAMFPTFGGGGADTEAVADTALIGSDGHVSAQFHRMEAEDQEGNRQLDGRSQADASLAAAAVSSSSSSFPSFAAAAPSASSLKEYFASIASFAADAKLGAQVARVRMGLDAKVLQACESPAVAKLGGSALGGVVRPRSVAAASGELDDRPGLRELINSSKASQDHLKIILDALEDYQRHRQGLADASHRLGLALQEAGQRSPGEYGEALSACGEAHQQAGSARTEACAAEELHVLSKLRAHDGKAASDCRRTVRQYEAAVHELALLRRARQDAQLAKQAASCDSVLAPTVEGDAARSEEAWVQRVQASGEAVQGKLSMFEAKHAVDYAASVTSHMKSVAAEESRVSGAFAEAAKSVEVVRRAAPACELIRQ
mmetsp:Transcript_76175/g.205494  ORF Transcript_76175/g.205494 Transcript_76175/m.205494 type:complete len:387 (-) Transcript_76175:135-1295(-)